MDYELLYSETAQADLANVPVGLIDAVEAHLFRLSRHPVSLSRPAAFPYPPGYQIYSFDLLDLQGNQHRYTVFFRYRANEHQLQIAMIGHVEFAD